MNVFKTTLSVTAALVLTACGSGGTYQPDSTHAPTVNPKPSVPPTTGGGNAGSQPNTPPNTGNTNNPPVPTVGNANAGYAKGYVNQDGDYREKNAPAPVAPASGSLSGDIVGVEKQLNVVHSQPPAGNVDYERISLNGVTLSLLPGNRGAFDGEISEAKDGLGLVVGKWLQYSSYGIVGQKQDGINYGGQYGLPVDKSRFGFAHGDATADMPTDGKARYAGYAVANIGLGKERPESSEHGHYPLGDFSDNADIEVDFGSKKLSGKIGQDANGILMTADISGNRFTGTAKDGTVTKGGFYGPNAAEMAGTFVNTNFFEEELVDKTTGDKTKGYFSIVGAFGAKKIDPARYKIDTPDDQK